MQRLTDCSGVCPNYLISRLEYSSTCDLTITLSPRAVILRSSLWWSVCLSLHHSAGGVIIMKWKHFLSSEFEDWIEEVLKWDSPVMAPLNLSFNLDSLSGSLWIFDTGAWSWRRLLTSFFSPSVYRKNRETHTKDEWILNRTVAETEPRELVLRTCSSLMFCSASDQSIAVCSLKATELRATVFSRVNPALHH